MPSALTLRLLASTSVRNALCSQTMVSLQQPAQTACLKGRQLWPARTHSPWGLTAILIKKHQGVPSYDKGRVSIPASHSVCTGFPMLKSAVPPSRPRWHKDSTCPNLGHRINEGRNETEGRRTAFPLYTCWFLGLECPSLICPTNFYLCFKTLLRDQLLWAACFCPTKIHFAIFSLQVMY